MEKLYKPNNTELNELRNIKIAHKIYLLILERVLSNLTENNNAVFKRKPDLRLKKNTSILKNYSKPKYVGIEFISFIEKMNDIAGLRLTITTRDEFDIAKRILSSSKDLQAYGVLDTESRKDNKVNGERNERGYGAHHYYMRFKLNLNSEDKDLSEIIKKVLEIYKTNRNDLKAEYEVIAEIQVRTLAQDLWAVFEHPERYKGSGEISRALNEELYNYSSLMEVADDIAKLTKNRKIYEAETYFIEKKKNPKMGNKLLFFNCLRDTIEEYLERKNVLGAVSIYDYCTLLMKLADNGIFTKEELISFLDNQAYIEAIDKQFSILNEKRNEIKISILDNVELLLMCRDCEIEIDNLNEKSKEFSQQAKELIKIRNSKIENRIIEIVTELNFEKDISDFDIK